MTALSNLRLKLNGVTPPSDEELALAAKELGMEVSEVKLMIERAQLAGMSLKSLKSTGGMSKLLAVLKTKKCQPGKYKVDGTTLEGAYMTPPTKKEDEEDKDETETRTKAGIAGGVPDGSETRAKRRQRMSTPLKDGVKGKLLALLHPDFPTSAVKEAIAGFTSAEKEEALSIMSSVQELLGIPMMHFKSSGTEWLDSVYDEVAVRTFKNKAVEQFGSDVFAKLATVRQVLSPQPMDQFTSKQLNGQPAVNRKYMTLAERNKTTHPLVEAEMTKLNQTTLKTIEAKGETEQQTAVEHAAALHDAFTSTMLNPQLLERVKEISDRVEVAQARFHDMFTSKRLNRDKTPEVQVSLKESQDVALTVEQSMAARDAALRAKWQATKPPEKPRGAPWLPGNL